MVNTGLCSGHPPAGDWHFDKCHSVYLGGQSNFMAIRMLRTFRLGSEGDFITSGDSDASKILFQHLNHHL